MVDRWSRIGFIIFLVGELTCLIITVTLLLQDSLTGNNISNIYCLTEFLILLWVLIDGYVDIYVDNSISTLGKIYLTYGKAIIPGILQFLAAINIVSLRVAFGNAGVSDTPTELYHITELTLLSIIIYTFSVMMAYRISPLIDYYG